MKLRVLMSILVIAGLVGCSPGASEHRALCKKDAGTVVYKKVKAKGFYHAQCNSSCRGLFLETYERRGLTYMEFNNDRTYSTADIPEKGYWRYFIAEKGSDSCNDKITKDIDSYPNPDDFIKNFRRQKCIASKKISSPSSKYEFVTNTEVLTVKNLYDSKIVKEISVVRDVESNTVIAEEVGYLLNPMPGTRIDGGEKRCRSFAKGRKPNQSKIYQQALYNKE